MHKSKDILFRKYNFMIIIISHIDIYHDYKMA